MKIQDTYLAHEPITWHRKDRTMTPHEIVVEFVTDLEAAYRDDMDALKEEWPDLHVTYIHAKEYLADWEAIS